MVMKLNFRIVKCGFVLATNVVKQAVTIVTSLSSRDRVQTTLSKILATPMGIICVEIRLFSCRHFVVRTRTCSYRCSVAGTIGFRYEFGVHSMIDRQLLDGK